MGGGVEGEVKLQPECSYKRENGPEMCRDRVNKKTVKVVVGGGEGKICTLGESHQMYRYRVNNKNQLNM